MPTTIATPSANIESIYAGEIACPPPGHASTLAVILAHFTYPSYGAIVDLFFRHKDGTGVKVTKSGKSCTFAVSKRMRTIVGILIGMTAMFVVAQVTTLGTVRAVRSSDGVVVVCRGQACGDLLDSLGAIRFKSLDLMPETFPETFLSKAQICGALRSRSPGACNVSSPPSVPAIDPNWQPNGCGDGSTGAQAASAMFTLLPPVGGNLNEPLPGVNFRTACNAHDRCYGLAGLKGNCDSLFRTQLNNVCASSGVSGCGTLAAGYEQAVREWGQDAYDTSVQERICAEFARDVNENGCAL